MIGPQRQVLKIIKQLRDADAETIASTMCVSAYYVKDLCQGLVQDDLLRQESGGEYKITPKGSKIQITGRQDRIQAIRDIEPRASSGITNRSGLLEKQQRQLDTNGDTKRYSIGEMIGEIKMKPDLPSPHQVEAALRSNPQSSYEEMEDRMTSYTLTCPAKGKEVTWHYCSACPHQKGIDFQKWTVQCSYEFNERRLDMIYGKEEIKALAGDNKGEFTDLDIEERIALPHVRCPSLGRVIAVDRCTDCRYQRDGEWHCTSRKRGVVGWVLCSAPTRIEKTNDDSRSFMYGGKEWRVVPPRWR